MSGSGLADARGCQRDNNEIDLRSWHSICVVSVAFGPYGYMHQGSLCREPRFPFAIILNTRHSPQASVRLEGSQKGAVQKRCLC